MARYAVPRSDGFVAIVTTVGNVDIHGQLALWTDRADYGSPVELKDNHYPDAGFRNAWTLKGGRLEVDMVGARKIFMEGVRLVRNRRLDELDKEVLRVADLGEEREVGRLRAERQRLRDLPATLLPAVEDAQTPDDLNRIQVTI